MIIFYSYATLKNKLESNIVASNENKFQECIILSSLTFHLHLCLYIILFYQSLFFFFGFFFFCFDYYYFFFFFCYFVFWFFGIFEMRLGYLCYLGYSDYCPHLYCYIHNVSADVPSGLLQVLPVELGNLLFELGNFLVVIGSFHGTSN